MFSVWASSSPGRWRRHTGRARCTATSNPATSCSPSTASRSSPTSGSPGSPAASRPAPTWSPGPRRSPRRNCSSVTRRPSPRTCTGSAPRCSAHSPVTPPSNAAAVNGWWRSSCVSRVNPCPICAAATSPTRCRGPSNMPWHGNPMTGRPARRRSARNCVRSPRAAIRLPSRWPCRRRPRDSVAIGRHDAPVPPPRRRRRPPSSGRRCVRAHRSPARA